MYSAAPGSPQEGKTQESHELLTLKDLAQQTKVWLYHSYAYGGDGRMRDPPMFTVPEVWEEKRDDLIRWSLTYSNRVEEEVPDASDWWALCVCETIARVYEEVEVSDYDTVLLQRVIKACVLFRQMRSTTVRLVACWQDRYSLVTARGPYLGKDYSKVLESEADFENGMSQVEKILCDLGFSCQRQYRNSRPPEKYPEIVVRIDKGAFRSRTCFNDMSHRCFGASSIALEMDLHSVLVYGRHKLQWEDVCRWTHESWGPWDIGAAPDSGIPSIPGAVLRMSNNKKHAPVNVKIEDVQGDDSLVRGCGPTEVLFHDFFPRASAYSLKHALAGFLGVLTATVLAVLFDSGTFHFLLALVCNPFLEEEVDLFWVLGWTRSAPLRKLSNKFQQSFGWHTMFILTIGLVEAADDLAVGDLAVSRKIYYVCAVGLFWCAVFSLGGLRVYALRGWKARNVYKEIESLPQLREFYSILRDAYLPLRSIGIPCVRCGDGGEPRLWWLCGGQFNPRNTFLLRSQTIAGIAHVNGRTPWALEDDWCLVGGR